MPFDQFFSSANKKHYIPRPGVQELYDELMALPAHERYERVMEMRDRKVTKGLTDVEWVVYKKIGFIFRHASMHKIHLKDDKEHAKCSARFEKARKAGTAFVVFGGFNSVTSSVRITGKR